jgi:MoxR-like ATPase
MEVVDLQDSLSNVRLDPSIVTYILDLLEATRKDERLHLGVSPRGGLALTQASQAAAMVRGRDYVLPDDVKGLFISCCGHRVIGKTYLHNGDGNSTQRVLESILQRVPAPR